MQTIRRMNPFTLSALVIIMNLAMNVGAQPLCQQALSSQWSMLRENSHRKFVLMNSSHATERAKDISRLLNLRLIESATPQISIVVTTSDAERSMIRQTMEKLLDDSDSHLPPVMVLELLPSVRHQMVKEILDLHGGRSQKNLVVFATDREIDEVFKDIAFQIQGLQRSLIENQLVQLVMVSPANEKIVGVARNWEQLFSKKDGMFVLKVLARDLVAPRISASAAEGESELALVAPTIESQKKISKKEKVKALLEALNGDDYQTLELFAKDDSFKKLYQRDFLKGIGQVHQDMAYSPTLRLFHYQMAQLHAWGIVDMPIEYQQQFFGRELTPNSFAKFNRPASPADKEKAAIVLEKLKKFIDEKTPEAIHKKLTGKNSEATWFKYWVLYYPTTNQQFNWRSFFKAEQLKKLDRANLP